MAHDADLLFVDDLGYPIYIGTQVGFTEEAGKALPSELSGLANLSYIVRDWLESDELVRIVAIRHTSNDPDVFELIYPRTYILVKWDQIGAI